MQVILIKREIKNDGPLEEYNTRLYFENLKTASYSTS